MNVDGKTVFGNKDSKKEFAFPKDWKDSLVVRQVQVAIQNGGQYEIPNTARLQTYTKEKFDQLVEQRFFAESNMKVTVLHEPK